jgi:hypothetical protein
MTLTEKVNYIGLLEEKQRRQKQRVLSVRLTKLYDWQSEFIASTKEYFE